MSEQHPGRMPETYDGYDAVMHHRMNLLLADQGINGIPTSYADLMEFDHDTRRAIVQSSPLPFADDYEHFMAKLPLRDFATHEVLARKQLGGITVAAGFWTLMPLIGRRVTRPMVDLFADFQEGKHTGHKRQFNKEYWYHVIDDYDGWLPIQITTIGEGEVFTSVPFPIAEVYGEMPAVLLNEQAYIRLGHTSRVATVAAQFVEALGDPWRMIEVAMRALPHIECSEDILLAMHVGGAMTASSNDYGCMMLGAPFKQTGTLAHTWFSGHTNIFEDPSMKRAFRILLGSELGPWSTPLLDLIKHDDGILDLIEVIEEGFPKPFGSRPDSGDTIKQGFQDFKTYAEHGISDIHTVIEDGLKGPGALKIERLRRQNNVRRENIIGGAGGAFIGPRSDLEFAYKGCEYHDGTPDNPSAINYSGKACFDDEMKQTHAGRKTTFQSEETGIFCLGRRGEEPPEGHVKRGTVLYDGLSNPGKPYFNPGYNPRSPMKSQAILDGVQRSIERRKQLGQIFTHDMEPNRNAINLTLALAEFHRKYIEAAKKGLRKNRT